MALLKPAIIKQAIEHPEPEVRRTALEHFAGTAVADSSVMNAVIASAERYGPAASWRLLVAAADLPQTPATLDWALGELDRGLNRDDVDEDNYHYALAKLVASAPPALLGPVGDRVAALPGFPEDQRLILDERLRLDAAGWDACWAEFEAIGQELVADNSPDVTTEQAARLNWLVEALAWHGHGQADFVLGLVRGQLPRDKRVVYQAVMPEILRLAGAMKLTPAVPRLVDHLVSEEGEELAEAAMAALAAIGNDTVTSALAQAWWDADDEARSAMAEVLGHIRTELAAERCLALLDREDSDLVAHALAYAAMEQLNPEAIEPVLPLVQGDADELEPDERDLRLALVAAATITGVRFADYDAWYRQAAEAEWGWRAMDRPRYRLSEAVEGLHRVLQAERERKPQHVFQLNLSLRGIAPRIWRRLRIPDCPLTRLHDILQVAFGWEGMHLYEFTINGVRYSDPEMMEGEHEADASATWLSDVAKADDKFVYVYDFGDYWEHQVVVEKVEPADDGSAMPLCIKGARAAPPEDVGGPGGYAQMLEAITDPDHEQHEEMLDWLGEDFDPQAFDPAAINDELRGLMACLGELPPSRSES